LWSIQFGVLNTFTVFATITAIHFWNFFNIPNRTLCPLSKEFYCSLLPALVTSILLSVCEFAYVWALHLRESHNIWMIQIIQYLSFYILSYWQHNISKVHLYCSIIRISFTFMMTKYCACTCVHMCALWSECILQNSYVRT
jgi:hypothetical protein